MVAFDKTCSETGQRAIKPNFEGGQHQRGGPLSAVPGILAGGIAIMAIAGITFFGEPASWQRLLGVALAISGLFLLRR